jgi:hypothetical protein
MTSSKIFQILHPLGESRASHLVGMVQRSSLVGIVGKTIANPFTAFDAQNGCVPKEPLSNVGYELLDSLEGFKVLANLRPVLVSLLLFKLCLHRWASRLLQKVAEASHRPSMVPL